MLIFLIYRGVVKISNVIFFEPKQKIVSQNMKNQHQCSFLSEKIKQIQKYASHLQKLQRTIQSPKSHLRPQSLSRKIRQHG